MTIDDIYTLIANDENRTLELKKTTGELKDAMHTACAFLNTEGGWIVFGVTPTSLKVIGQDYDQVSNNDKLLIVSKKNPYNGTSDLVDDQVNDQVSNNIFAISEEKKRVIIAYCMIPRSRREIFNHIGLKNHTDSYKRYIKPLIESGELELTCPESPNNPRQKYVAHHSVKK